ncbi:MAG: hypothetical protein ACRD36_13535, partial [Candidatus Acidiferrum sp.]
MKRLPLTLVLGLTCMELAVVSRAEPPAEALTVTREAGQWLICAASYMGPDAPSLAHQLAEQIRTRDNMPAYVYNRADEERRSDREAWEKVKAAHPGAYIPFRHARYTDQCAVLVGGYPDLNAANAALAKVKKLPPPVIKLSNGQPGFDEEYVQSTEGDQNNVEKKKVRVNPFSRAFAIHNPTIPIEKPVAAKFDPAWKSLNAGESYSLLKNPKTFTLVVKDYAGATQVQF